MAEAYDPQQEVRRFVTETLHDAFDRIAASVNDNAELAELGIRAEVKSSLPPKGLGRETLVISAPAASGNKVVPIYICIVDGSPYLSSARIVMETGPIVVDGVLKNSHKDDFVVPTVPVTTDANVTQTRAVVQPWVDAAIEGYQVRQRTRQQRS